LSPPGKPAMLEDSMEGPRTLVDDRTYDSVVPRQVRDVGAAGLSSLAAQAAIQRGHAALRIAPIEDLGAGDASVYAGSPCTRCMLTMLPLGTPLPAVGV